MLLAASLVFVWGISCNKDDEAVNIPTKTELLSRTWKMTALKATVEGQTLNYMDSVAACVNDNLYIFINNGTYRSEEGATKCNADDPVVLESGTWQFTSNESQLKLEVESWQFISGENPWDIVKLDATTLQLRYVIPAEGEIPEITFEITFGAL